LPDLPPWLNATLIDLIDQYRANTLPHGLLILGDPGHGGTLMTDALVAKLLCRSDLSQACGDCKACRLHQAGNHPDFIRVQPEGKSLTIRVDSVRAINRKVAETAQQGGNKVIRLENAEKMNANAANALLKVLEEPSDRTFIVLESRSLGRTLPTIRSRCRLVTLPEPSLDQALAVLHNGAYPLDPHIALGIAQGKPYTALSVTADQLNQWSECERRFSQDLGFSQLSQFIHKAPLEPTLKQLMLWVDTAIRQRLSRRRESAPVADDMIELLANKTARSLFDFRDYLVVLLGAINRQSNLNTQLMGEELASRWLDLRGTE
tara:strand:+ start:22 stop:981 length:960 start_codon:yes stop_codon:yes gene_type:complete